MLFFFFCFLVVSLLSVSFVFSVCYSSSFGIWLSICLFYLIYPFLCLNSLQYFAMMLVVNTNVFQHFGWIGNENNNHKGHNNISLSRIRNTIATITLMVEKVLGWKALEFSFSNFWR